MGVENFKGCEKCKHMKNFGGPKYYCYYGPISRPCSDMRQPKGMCGPDGNLWEAYDVRKDRSVHDA